MSEVDVKTPGGDERNYKTSTGGSDFPRGRERERETERVCVKKRDRERESEWTCPHPN